MHPPLFSFFLAHLTQRVMLAFVITLRPSSVRPQLLKIFSSETTWPLKTKLWWNGPWVIPFQNCVRQSRQPTNMATVAKNRNGGMKFCFPLKLLGQLDSSFAKIILWWYPFKNMSGSPVSEPRYRRCY